ncbi:MAG: folate-binding protein [Hyphomicrobiales bacterium]|nr:MAG: folate-binding protein [Hyphomicrobiales bacterium]
MQGTASAVDKSRPGRTSIAHLPDRGVVGVTGPDAEQLLQGLVTQDMARLGEGAAIYAGLLSPQGKILFDFFVVRTPDGLLIEVAADKAADLIKRLTMYRLRAKVTFTDRTGDMRVLVAWGAGTDVHPSARSAVAFADPRLHELGVRMLVSAQDAEGLLKSGAVSAQDWHAHRIALGVPEGGKDFAYGDAFPHEADMDQLNGVSFEKGCYVGQEVVSRMQHRGTARKRVVIVTGDREIAGGAAISAGGAPIGSVGGSAGQTALALLRLDRAAEATGKGETLFAGDVPVAIMKPSWAHFDLVPRKPAGDDL